MRFEIILKEQRDKTIDKINSCKRRKLRGEKIEGREANGEIEYVVRSRR